MVLKGSLGLVANLGFLGYLVLLGLMVLGFRSRHVHRAVHRNL